MKTSHAVIIAAVLVVVIVGAVLWSGKEDAAPQLPPKPLQDDASIPRNPGLVGDADAITVRHRYFSGTHAWSGTLTTPTPCHQVSAETRVMESYPEQVVLSLSVQEPAPGMVCVQVIAEQPFHVTARASEEATVRGELNGAPVRLEVVEGGVEFEGPPLGVELVP